MRRINFLFGQQSGGTTHEVWYDVWNFEVLQTNLLLKDRKNFSTTKQQSNKTCETKILGTTCGTN